MKFIQTILFLLSKKKIMTEDKHIDIKKINEKINKESAIIDLLSMEISKVIVGQKKMVDRLLVLSLIHI